jgi:putative two-component system response regulator
MQKNQKFTILVVDDVKESRVIAEEILAAAKYRLRSASNGVDALRMVKQYHFDLILLDIAMPDMSGLEVCRFLKMEKHSSHIPVIFLTGSTEKELLAKAYKVGGSDYIRKPFSKEELLARVQTRLELREYEKNLEETVKKRTQEMYETQIHLMHVLGGIAEGHSKETHYHVQRVGEFSYHLAKLAGLHEKEARLLQDAATLHDIGKLAVDNAIVHKNGILTSKELKEMKKHPIYGAKMLQHSELPLFKTASIVALEHHEKWDGSGYPKGLKKGKIHIYGRIVAIADVFDALSFKRSYKDKWDIQEVLNFMQEMSGKHFDPNLIEIFFDNIDIFLNIYDEHHQKVVPQKGKKSLFGWLKKSALSGLNLEGLR